MKPIIFDEQATAYASNELDQVLILLQLTPHSHVLDLCCGVGRHSLELVRRGYRVTGVDRTSAYLKEARAAARAECLDVEFVCADMRDFVRPKAFDGAINLYTSFGYFRKQEDDLRVIRNLANSLKPGARLVMDMVGQEIFMRNFRPHTERVVNSVTLSEELTLTDDGTWLENRRVIENEGQRQTFTISHRLYTASALTTLLRQGGLSTVAVYGDLAGSPYDVSARRLVAVATV